MSTRHETKPQPDLPARHEDGALAASVARWIRSDGDWESPIPGLALFRRENPRPPCLCLVEPSIVLAVQGEKQMLVGDECYTYDAQHFLISALDLPAHSEVVNASAAHPCLGLALKLDLRLMSELIVQGGIQPPRDAHRDSCVGLGTVTTALLDGFARLLALLDEPAAIPVLAPLIQREIHFRLLLSDQAARLWQIAAVGSQSNRIARAIDWLKANFDQPLRVEALAAHVQMSPSNLHHHFRLLTEMSPLQYQKWLRLNEARRLMLNEDHDAASAAFHVGYESASQFSREYSRLFGAPPKRDIERLRQGGELAGT